ncbi:hypothetical protein H5410_060385 [Solanum commersonii]|uniref:Uncharacterized protein n=1 Tax=Solanum commersonii TaxID=4109 RepID=A0A9J5W4Y0_SOLCO|nr:hypothetical protein H5410_060385 [Solanum commersonii]
MLIEVNVSNPLPDEITVLESNGRKIKQVVTYDWRPKFCPQRSVVGHCCRPKPLIPGKGDQKRQQATKKVTQEWKYKGVIPTTTTTRICEDEQAHTPTQEPPNHTPMQFNLKTTHWIPRTPFRFFNIWADHSKFRSIIEDIWARQMATDPMENLWSKLRMLKSPLKDLNKEGFKGIEMKLSKARMDLQQVQDQLTRNSFDTLILLEKKILQDLEKWSNIEESALK